MKPILIVLVLITVLTGCTSSVKKEADDKKRFTAGMNAMVGKVTYEQVLTNWGPPSNRKEGGNEISGVWEQAPGAFSFSSEKNFGGDIDYYGWRVKMVFDRKSLVMKSWEELK